MAKIKLPNEIQQELEQIAEQNNGLIRPIDIIEFAKDKKTALHNRFEWDDSKAGQLYRLEQARRIIRLSVTVTNGPETETRMFVSLEEDRHDEGGYRLVVDVLSDEEKRKSLLKQVRKELKVIQVKYAVLKELAKSFEQLYAEIDKAMNS